MGKNKRNSDKVRYAVVGLGYISQIAVLPAFKNAKKNSQLVALVSDDAAKRSKLGRKYGVSKLYDYQSYDHCLQSGEVDAVYIALPNHMHHEYTIRAARAGLHVLCEKPMALTTQHCQEMIDVCQENSVKLMIAYRLHFEQANLNAISIVTARKLGDLRSFNSVFTMQVQEGNIRLQEALGGGTLYDIGIYCINAARYLFRAEPVKVFASLANSGDQRFSEVEETMGGILAFPQGRLATFTCSFGASDVSTYQIVGTQGDLVVNNAYEFASEITHTLTVKEKKRQTVFSKRDQFGPELLYFSDCILQNKQPEPSGMEGMADVRVINALYRSAKEASPVVLSEFDVDSRPTAQQQITRPAVKRQPLYHAQTPTR